MDRFHFKLYKSNTDNEARKEDITVTMTTKLICWQQIHIRIATKSMSCTGNYSHLHKKLMNRAEQQRSWTKFFQAEQYIIKSLSVRKKRKGSKGCLPG